MVSCKEEKPLTDTTAAISGLREAYSKAIAAPMELPKIPILPVTSSWASKKLYQVCRSSISRTPKEIRSPSFLSWALTVVINTP